MRVLLGLAREGKIVRRSRKLGKKGLRSVFERMKEEETADGKLRTKELSAL
jgi:hypothetical protein